LSAVPAQVVQGWVSGPAPLEVEGTARPFGARLRRIRNWQSSEFYARLVMRPLAILVMLVVADWRWLTPNLVTTLGSLAKLGGAALIVADHREHAVAAAMALQLGLLLDHLDGTIARYRSCGTAFGAFYDKVSDAVTWLAITAAIGWAAYAETGDARLPIAAVASGHALLVLGYMKWLNAAAQRHASYLAALAQPDRATRARPRDDAAAAERACHAPPVRSARQWLRWLGSSLARALRFEEVDLFFWIGLGLVLGELALLCWLLAISQAIQLVIMMVVRGREAHALDTARTVRVAAERARWAA
jgi:phosphatidylglycerophosphate synthase